MRARIKAAGKAAGVHAYPHRLRHTAATQLLNAGCRITSIQKFLGHKELSSTMVYARVHDQTVADDYYTAMAKVEKRLELLGAPEEGSAPIEASERQQLLALAVQLAQPEVSAEARLSIVSQMHILLVGKEMAWEEPSINDYGRKQWEHPPPSPVLFGVG